MSSSSTSPTTLSKGGAIAHATLEEELIIRRCLSPILRRRCLCRDQLAGQVSDRPLLILELTHRPFLPLPIKNRKLVPAKQREDGSTIIHRKSLHLRSPSAFPTAAPKTSPALPIPTAAHPATLSGIRKTSSALPDFSATARKTHAALPISPAPRTIAPARLRKFLAGQPAFPAAVRIFAAAASPSLQSLAFQ